MKSLAKIAVLVIMCAGGSAGAQTVFSLPLTYGIQSVGGAISSYDAGFFAGGTQLLITASGTGDLVNSNYQANPDGSMAAPAGGPYTYANPGATYNAVSGFPSGDGINHFPGGGSNYDFTGTGWGFAGLQTTDTTNPAIIRDGAVVATFSANPVRTDWLYADDTTLTVPSGGADLYFAVDDSYNPDNHGSYGITIQTVPEPASEAMLVSLGIAGFAAYRRSHRRI